MTTFYESVTSALTMSPAVNTGGGTFNPVVVQSLGLGQKQGRDSVWTPSHGIAFLDVANYEPRETIIQALYLSHILTGIHSGQKINQTLTLADILSPELTANRTLDGSLTLSQFVSAYIVGLRETCVASPSGTTTLTTITGYSDTLSSGLTLAQTLAINSTFNPHVIQTLNLISEIQTGGGTFSGTASNVLALSHSVIAELSGLQIIVADTDVTFTDVVIGSVV